MGINRHRGLYQQLTRWSNLMLAAKRASRAKRFRADVLATNFNLESVLLKIQNDLESGSFQFSGYRSFQIRDPKTRLISAAPFLDRIVHHGICNIIEPIFDQRFIFDSYACRERKGQSAALQRAIKFARRYRYVLKTDVAKYFHSIDHQTLLAQIARMISDQNLLALLRDLIATPFPGQLNATYFPNDDLFAVAERTVGLPIGNQTSQLFGNVFLDPLDHAIKTEIRVPGYIRYMDDMVLFGNDKTSLFQALDQIHKRIESLRLRLSSRKTWLTTTEHGFPFLGFTVAKTKIRPSRKNVVRFKRRLNQLQKQWEDNQINLETIRQSIYSYWGFFAIANQRNRFRTMLKDFSMFAALAELERQKREEKNFSRAHLVRHRTEKV